MIQESLHKKIVEHCKRVDDWFSQKSQGLQFPFYSSFDIRDSGIKIAPVDANIFPAGFNNICGTDKETAVDTARNYLDKHYGTSLKNILLLTEEHTQNPYYWDNVYTLMEILLGTGRDVRVAMPASLPHPLTLKSASGHEIKVFGAHRSAQGIDIEGFKPELIINNNDFSLEKLEWSEGLQTPMNPPRELGWYRRRKARFFAEYNKLAREFAELIDLDPWQIQIETVMFEQFDVEDESSRAKLAMRAGEVRDRIGEEYKKHGYNGHPFLFVKNNSGTYGLGVIAVQDPDEIRNWNYKARKKMKAAKGGREISEVIIQEGIPTIVKGPEGQSAEPCIYMIGCQLAGGFLRTHQEKGPEDSLNSPGAVFKRLCVSDLKIKQEGCPMENAYGWIAKLAFLSVAKEAKALGVGFPAYREAEIG